MDYVPERVLLEVHGKDSLAGRFRPWAEPRGLEAAVRWVAVNELDMSAVCDLQATYELPPQMVQAPQHGISQEVQMCERACLC